MKKKKIGFGIAIVLIGVALMVVSLLLDQPYGTANRKIILSGGSTFELETVVFAEGYQYSHWSGPDWLSPFRPLIPDSLEAKILGMSAGRLGFGGGATNLILITILENGSKQPLYPSRLRIRNDEGDTFDANWGAHTLGINSQTVNGWEIRAFPRRSRKLTAEFLSESSDQKFELMASFEIDNPVYSENHPVWEPLPLPQTDASSDPAVRLDQFKVIKTGEGEFPAQFGQLEFSFHHGDQPLDHYEIQTVNISDAAGNNWKPYLNHRTTNSPSWSQKGGVQFFGGLWESESAWKLIVTSFPIREFETNSIWDVPTITLPQSGASIQLTNSFGLHELDVELATILAPGVTTTNDWQSALRYWGDEQRVYPLGVQFKNGIDDRQLVFLPEPNETRATAKLLELRKWGNDRQVLFIQIPESETRLKFKLAFPKLIRSEFVARPEFVD